MSSLEERETLASLFLLPDNIAVEAVYPTKSRLTLQISCTLKSASCPICQQSSERVHGRYGRTVADVPCGGRLVTLALTVRKFVCGTQACPRRIFTERLPDLVQSYARMTNRLSEALQTLGFATCGELGERFAPKLGMQVSGPTLLRRMRTCSYTPPASVSVLGIDDWGATRSHRCSCKNSRKEDFTWGSAPKCPTRLNQVRLGQCSRVREDGLEPVRRRGDC